MFNQDEQDRLLTFILDSFNRQKGTDFVPEDFDMYLGAPNQKSYCSVNVVSKVTNDNFRIKAYLTKFDLFNSIDNFRLLQEQNYSTGPRDEVQVTTLILRKEEFRSLMNFVLSSKFTTYLNDSILYLQLEDGSGNILTEDGNRILITQ